MVKKKKRKLFKKSTVGHNNNIEILLFPRRCVCPINTRMWFQIKNRITYLLYFSLRIHAERIPTGNKSSDGQIPQIIDIYTYRIIVSATTMKPPS